jgi:hypothetical protein
VKGKARALACRGIELVKPAFKFRQLPFVISIPCKLGFSSIELWCDIPADRVNFPISHPLNVYFSPHRYEVYKRTPSVSPKSKMQSICGVFFSPVSVVEFI